MSSLRASLRFLTPMIHCRLALESCPICKMSVKKYMYAGAFWNFVSYLNIGSYTHTHANFFFSSKKKLVSSFFLPWVLVRLSKNPQAIVLSLSAPSSVLDSRDLSRVSKICIPSCSSTLFLPMSVKIEKIQIIIRISFKCINQSYANFYCTWLL